MEIPEGWEDKFNPDEVLLLKKAAYGMVDAGKRFWLSILNTMDEMEFKRSKMDPCLYYKWDKNGLCIITSYVDDVYAAGTKAAVMEPKRQFFEHYKCDDVGEAVEYLGNKVSMSNGTLKLTQPVLIQSFKDEFQLPDQSPTTPAVPSSQQRTGETPLEPDQVQKYRSAVGKLIHLMKWSRPDILNATRDLSRFMMKPSYANLKAVNRLMSYCLKTPN